MTPATTVAYALITTSNHLRFSTSASTPATSDNSRVGRRLAVWTSEITVGPACWSTRNH